MKTIRIRKFTLLSLFFISLVPWVFLVTAHVINTKTFSFDPTDSQQANLKQTARLIEANMKNWTDQAWQMQFSAYLQEQDVEAEIVSAAGEVIFQSNAAGERRFTISEQFSLVEDGNVTARVVVYQQNSRAIQLIAAFAGFLLALFLVGLAMRRWIITPLEQLSFNARRLADGDFEVELPSSRMKEIADVRDGFQVMVRGLTESFRKQIELEEERRFVIAAVAHDLRTPLFALRGYLDGLEQGVARSPEQISKYVAVCKEKSAQLDHLVEELFTFTKTDYRESPLQRKLVDFGQVCKQAVDTITPQARQRDVSILVKEAEASCSVLGDAHLLERALTNMLDNAVLHSPQNGKIVIEYEQIAGNVSFTFRDEGMGFTAEELQHVFAPLYRGEESRNRATGGVGLGLTIARRIMEQHGGELHAANHPDGGAVLSGRIPAASE
ncbi:HAMP domain-containing histidine kinase [Alkalihalobacillus oceani]|uniref:histidine kinase n=1 Tax=Halalkalibacter oceani TaxID=1653776 RepID=A0A9X2DQP4_9BACI|nr:HAMP domain-containing sensor histidine kinase [Halalkalibacter oceani]MCM3714405.1 HAMP domain-containing histidine kinase [Halalkalibacter oceani]